MNLFEIHAGKLRNALAGLSSQGKLAAGLDLARVVVEPPRDPSHGDLATNAAMVLAKEAGTNPRALAELIATELRADPDIAAVEIAGPGFINLRLEPHVWSQVMAAAVKAGATYGLAAPGSREAVNVEYVSANPTGPMHVGHGRGAVFGDALAALLEAGGYKVTREYYINDAGAQVDVLARSAFHRYREALGEDPGPVEEGLYPGDYLVPVGQALASLHGRELIEMAPEIRLPILRQAAIEMMLVLILKDLDSLGVKFDVFFSERALQNVVVKFTSSQMNTSFYTSLEDDIFSGPPGGIRDYFSDLGRQEGNNDVFSSTFAEAELGSGNYLGSTLASLKAQGLIYEGRLPPPKGQKDEDWEDREQTLFRATQFGDDVDRPLLKSDGGYTYFASDIAYHKSKFDRGFTKMIDVWGADHGGYVKRMQAAVKAVSGGKGDLDVKLVQLVRLLRNGEPVKMSKRAGDFVTLREVVEELDAVSKERYGRDATIGERYGRDAVRFMMLFRKNDATLDFDLAKAVEQSKDNPVFYVQYAHARCASVLRQAREAFPAEDFATVGADDFALLTDPSEIGVMKLIAQYPRLIEQAAGAHEPHRVAFYAHDLASALHSLWNRGKDEPHLRFINHTDRLSTRARVGLVLTVKTVLASALGIAGVASPDEMR